MSDTADDALVEAVCAGQLRASARLITRIESSDPTVVPLLQALYRRRRDTPVLGITGPPGAGKSTLIDRLVEHLRARGQRLAVLAVDPSSPFTGGAILGDRVRMSRHNADPGVFIRSMSSRGRLGGLARAAGDALVVLDAMGWDLILVETVGVGQSEIDILRHARSVVIVQTPGGGDVVQALKAGLLEIGDLFVVNKAEQAGAERMCAALREAVEYRHAHRGESHWLPPVLSTQASAGIGIDDLMRAWDAHLAHFAAHPAQLAARRRDQVRARVLELAADLLRARSEHALVHSPAGTALVDAVLAGERDPHGAADALLSELAGS